MINSYQPLFTQRPVNSGIRCVAGGRSLNRRVKTSRKAEALNVPVEEEEGRAAGAAARMESLNLPQTVWDAYVTHRWSGYSREQARRRIHGDTDHVGRPVVSLA